jgi:hypothetical protein
LTRAAPNSSASGRVEASADLGHRFAGLEIGLHRSCSLDEQRLGLLIVKRSDLVLVLRGETERLSARHQQRQLWSSRKQFGEPRTNRQKLLQVVEEQEHAPVADMVSEPDSGPDRLSDFRQHEPRVPKLLQRHPENPVRVIGRCLRGHLERQPRLAAPADAGQGQ